MDQRLDDIIGLISILINLSSRVYLLTRDFDYGLEKNSDKGTDQDMDLEPCACC